MVPEKSDDHPDPKKIIVAIFDIHNPGRTPFECGTINENGFHRMVAFLNAIPQDSSLGALILDSCSTLGRSLTDIFSFMSGNGIMGGASCQPTDLFSPETATSFVVGGNTNAGAVQKFADNEKYTVVTPDGSSLSLKKGGYMFRTIPSYRHEAKAIVRIIKRLNWNYVSLINSNDEYGKNSAEEFFNHVRASETQLCVAKQSLLSTRDATVETAENILKDFKTVGGANVIVLFTNEEHTRMLIQAAKNLNDVNRFLFLSGSKWNSDPNYITDVRDATRKAIALKVFSENMPSFSNFMSSLTLSNTRGIPVEWVEEYIQVHHKCKIPSAKYVQTQFSKKCDNKQLSIDGDKLYHDPSIFHTNIAANVMRQAIEKSGCRTPLTTNADRLCLRDAIRNITYLIPGEQDVQFNFTTNNDGNVDYEVLEYDASTSKYNKVMFHLKYDMNLCRICNYYCIDTSYY